MRSLRSVTITIGISSTFKRKQWFPIPTMDHLPFSFPIKFSIQFSFLHFFFKSKHKLPSLITSTIVNRICLPFPLYKISTPLNLPAIEKIILHHFLIPPKIPNSECIRLDCISIMRLPRSSNGGKGEEGESWEKGHVPSTFRAHA